MWRSTTSCSLPGISHSYFAHPDWEPLAPGLKTVEDALEIRRRFLLAFEEAERDLSIPNHPNIFAIGDLAHALQKNGELAPGVAQVAMQEGRIAARNIIASIQSRARSDFDYFNKEDLATIGRGRAIANLFGGKIKVGGRIAWMLWLGIHITYLIGFRNRLSVLLQWAYAYFTYQRGARLITETTRSITQRRS